VQGHKGLPLLILAKSKTKDLFTFHSRHNTLLNIVVPGQWVPNMFPKGVPNSTSL
jgi:hypothetical protein